MSKQGIRPERLAAEIQKQLKEYSEEVKETTRKTAMEVAEKAVRKLQEESPKRTGDYAKSWTYAEDRNGSVIYSESPEYRLTHLLEKGHALRRGGRRVGESPASPHIAMVEADCVEEYIQEVERRVKR